jgi:hypothetical protein
VGQDQDQPRVLCQPGLLAVGRLGVLAGRSHVAYRIGEFSLSTALPLLTLFPGEGSPPETLSRDAMA